MPAYLVALVGVTDPEQYAKYSRLTPAAIAEFGGRFVIRGGHNETLEGPLRPGRVVVIEFSSFERAKEFYQSEQYQEARKLRVGAADASFILAEGWEEQ